MTTYRAPLEDMRFLLNHVVDFKSVTELPGYEEATPDLVDAVLEEMAKFSGNVLAPLNEVADRQGCTHENGVVRMPEGFKEAFDAYCEGGWMGLNEPVEEGGQGLPKSLGLIMEEMLNASNMAFAMTPGLTRGACEAIRSTGSDEQKALYLPKMVAGTWTGTMCLTEPHCGTDLGLIRSKAEPNGDGSYIITGNKIFISSGEHNLAENIIHLVLAKLPDAPSGTGGISLFVVPKFIPKQEGDDWVPGERNNLMCTSIEHKMGLKGSPTCAMAFDGAKGWLVGEPHKGLRAMFIMMNAARLGVGVQALAVAETSYQNALAYAQDRLQGRAVTGAVNKEGPADPIIVHPDVRRNLLTMRAYTEGLRALAYDVGVALDLSSRHPDESIRERYDDYVQLMTPIVKACSSDWGYEVTNIGMQILGGHGYIADWGMEQLARDCRITQIYEGTNGIQAMDLVGRKLPMKSGRPLGRFTKRLEKFLAEHADDAELKPFVAPLQNAANRLQQAVGYLMMKGMADPNEALAAASDFLRLFGLTAVGFTWARMAVAAQKALVAGEGDEAFLKDKLAVGRFYMARLLPQVDSLVQAVSAGADTLKEGLPAA